MSDIRLTQDELRDEWMCDTDHGTMECLCLQDWPTHRPERHRPGCPCDPANVVVSRAELSGAVEWLSVGFSGGERYEYGSCEWCDAQWDTRSEHPAPWHLDTCPLYVEPAP